MVGVWNPAVGIMLIVFAIFAASLFGFMNIGVGTILGILVIGMIIIWRLKT